MKRIAHLALAIALIHSTGSIAAENKSVEEIQQQIQTNQSEYDSYHRTLESEIALAAQLERELSALRARNKELEHTRQVRLNEMNVQYERTIEDPSLDINQAREAYLSAMRAHKENKDAITAKYNEWQSKLQDVEQLRLSKHSLLNKIESLKEQLNNARVDRLFNEFNRQDQLTVNHEITCDRNETIGKCTERGKFLAKQKASKRFLDQLYDGLTEAAAAKQHRPYSEAYVMIQRSDVTRDGFSGAGNYAVQMNVELKGNLKRTEACQLLGLDKRYCVAERTLPEVAKVITVPVQSDGSAPVDESVMYELTVRSNVYDDEVFIDGVSYGSTKLQIMLPAGPHELEVVKRGYETFRQTLQLKESTTLKVDMKRAQFAFNKGEKVQDILYGDVPGPQLVVVPAGSFRMGDINGTGLENERPVQTQTLNNSFGIGEFEITVADFRRFVEETSYVTEAEKDRGCAFYEQGEPVWQDQLNWRTPGYAVTDSHPVTCISQRDALAYVNWLSEASGNKYRLPTEIEWEYAARANTETDFWWGESVGTGNANCGWCGSQWSNISPAPVASFDRNSFGLFDTVGNVWEWTVSSSSQDGAVVRGGAWNFAPRLARVSTRMELDPNFRANYIGLRVVRER
ncbi:formylglycine-generating enzyme family protein [Bowmanella dokdonensis]|uniref:SUMF1/EgtB/PvdO family nonheme iron enzyme n=1 Tax=Bowmanella dokdonensis TaxID=751969 RepID=A0A939IPE6_9ALTE|nr:formylglycine-generating enzyme family protein [Bowmanella dokdonensis]MBN7825810.1 SUMF1/EgtB/PvdO family nonheme iron enzyme [Bowmanella dokdonensis]